jgi:hypothetical protein
MFIRSNTLTKDDIFAAVQTAREDGEDIYVDEDGIRVFHARQFRTGFQFYCESLNGKRARNGRPGRSASWDAYGVFMAELYKLDPTAEISQYKNAADFMDWTEFAADTNRGRPAGKAPWLTDYTLQTAADDTRDESTPVQKSLARYARA